MSEELKETGTLSVLIHRLEKYRIPRAHELKERVDKDSPFFLNVWFNEPHHKLASPSELIAKHSDLEPKEALY